MSPNSYIEDLRAERDRLREAVARVEALAADLVDVADDYRHATAGSHDAGARNAHYAVARRIRTALGSTDSDPALTERQAATEGASDGV